VVVYQRILPIAADGAGNPICIGVADAIYGKIFIWWHEEENDLTCLADDFDSFLNSLRDDD
jgi:cell wall assembly regulator SMI1